MNHHVVGLYNWDAKAEVDIDYALERMGLDPAAQYCGFDFWENKFIEPFSGHLARKLRPASTSIIAVRQVKDHPQVISTSRHVTQGVVDLTAEHWDAASRTLSGTSQVIGNDPYELRIVVPAESFVAGDAALAQAPQGAEVAVKQEKMGVRVTIKSQTDGEVKWTVKF